MPRPLKVLIAEDNPADAELLLRELRRAGFEPDWERVDTEEAYLRRLDGGLDLVLSDYQMPQFNGMRALELLTQRGLDVPFILVSGTIGEDVAVATMKNGATDYLLKDRLGRLGAAVTHALAESRLRRERRRADEALTLADAQLHQLLEHSPAVLYALKLEGGKIVPHQVSENLTSLLGFTVAEAMTYDWWLGQLHPDDRERALESVTETLEEGASLTEYRLRHKDGHYCWISDTRRVIRDAAGQPVELIGVWTDITEHKRAEETIRQASGHLIRNRRKQLRLELAILAIATAAVYALSDRFEWFRVFMRWILAHDVEQFDDMAAAALFLFVGLAVFVFRRWRETLSELTGRHQTQAALALLHDELDLRVKQRTVELGNANQALRAEMAERKQLEDQYRQAQKMEAIGTLAGGIAHDFNNILAAIVGYSDLARMVLTDNPEVRKYLAAVLQATRRAADLVRQILTFSRQQPLERRPIQLRPVVEETIELLRATLPSTIEIDTSLAKDTPTVLADATQIHQILMNLGTNAWHAMKDGTGRLQVALEPWVIDAAHPAPDLRLRAGFYARVTFRDTGCGMSPATLQRIFEPFFTTKPLGVGTGLGLAVVHGIMDTHDGAITVDSEPGKGTSFHLYFPADAGVAIPPPPKEIPVPRGHGERVLVVDDEEVIANLLQKSLTALGYEAEFFTNSSAALASVRADPPRFALVLTDQTMPGMTGLVFANQLRQIRPGLPVIMMSGYTPALLAERVQEAGICQLLTKPMTIRTLGIAVHSALSATVPSSQTDLAMSLAK